MTWSCTTTSIITNYHNIISVTHNHKQVKSSFNNLKGRRASNLQKKVKTLVLCVYLNYTLSTHQLRHQSVVSSISLRCRKLYVGQLKNAGPSQKKRSEGQACDGNNSVKVFHTNC